MNQERVARGIVDVQESAYDFFGIDFWPEDEAWMEDQIRKCS